MKRVKLTLKQSTDHVYLWILTTILSVDYIVLKISLSFSFSLSLSGSNFFCLFLFLAFIFSGQKCLTAVTCASKSIQMSAILFRLFFLVSPYLTVLPYVQLSVKFLFSINVLFPNFYFCFPSHLFFFFFISFFMKP